MNKTVIASFVAAALTSSVAFANGALHCDNMALHARVAKAEAVLNQNSAVNTVSTHNWFDRISVGGLVNVDANWSDTFPAGSFFNTSNSSDININNANLFVDAKINCWVKAHMNLAYLGDERDWTHRFPWIFNDKVGVRDGDSMLSVDEAYVTIGNFARTPFYAIIGKQYIPFGTYNRYPIILPFTQLLSQTRKTAINFGVVTDMGFYANVYAFNGGTAKIGKIDKDIENFGAKAGFFGSMHNVGLADAHYDVNVSWIRNIYDTDTLSPIFHYGSAANFNVGPAGAVLTTAFGYPSTTNGLALHGDATFGKFDASANFVTSLKRLGATFRATLFGVPVVNVNLLNRKLWAADINAGYKFMTWNRASRVGFSYQQTGGGDVFNPVMAAISVAVPVIAGYPISSYSPIPHRRYVIDYRVHVWNMTDLGLAYAHTVSYRDQVNNNRRKSNELLARLSVRF